MLAADVSIAAGAASRPYDYDFSRVYSGVISLPDRGWMYDTNLAYVYGSSLSDVQPMAITPEIKVGTIVGAVALLAVLGVGITLAIAQRK